MTQSQVFFTEYSGVDMHYLLRETISHQIPGDRADFSRVERLFTITGSCRYPPGSAFPFYGVHSCPGDQTETTHAMGDLTIV